MVVAVNNRKYPGPADGVMPFAATWSGGPHAMPCAIVRGGTSKGIFVLDGHLPADPELRDRLLLQLMGSPDARQIDGLGGADPLTSKVAIVSPSLRPGIDVEYESVEVGIAEARVNHGLVCGNLLAGVGPFALAEGLIKGRTPVTWVSIFCRSSGKTVVAKVPTDGATAPVELVFPSPGGALTGRLLPTGEPLSRIRLDDGWSLDVSIVDAGTLYALVRADLLGITGHESAAELDANAALRTTIESVRRQTARLISRSGAAVAFDPRLVKVAVVGRPGHRDDVDIVARVINSARTHKAYAVSGGICLAAAAAIKGTPVHDIVRPRGSPFELRIGHPSGSLSLRMYWSLEAGGTVIDSAELECGARIILRGEAYLPPESVASSADKVQRETFAADLAGCLATHDSHSVQSGRNGHGNVDGIHPDA